MYRGGCCGRITYYVNSYTSSSNTCAALLEYYVSFLLTPLPAQSAAPFHLLCRISNRVLPSAFIRIYIIFSCCCYICFFLGLFSWFFFFLILFCYCLVFPSILHPRRDAKWAIKARFDCGPDVLNGSDVQHCLFPIRHSPLALPNPKVHAEHNRNNLSSYTTLPYPTLSTPLHGTVSHPQDSPFDTERERRSRRRRGRETPKCAPLRNCFGPAAAASWCIRIPGIPYTVLGEGFRFGF